MESLIIFTICRSSVLEDIKHNELLLFLNKNKQVVKDINEYISAFKPKDSKNKCILLRSSADQIRKIFLDYSSHCMYCLLSNLEDKFKYNQVDNQMFDSEVIFKY
jgi:hypothetical protein